MGLVTAKEIAKFLHIEKSGIFGDFVGDLFLKMTRISKLNRIYNANKHQKDLVFFDALVDDFNIKFEIPKEDLKRIPKTGSFITVSNHPLGGIDGILLLKLLVAKRPDYKIIANFLLHKIDPMKPYILPVNPFEDHKDAKSSIGGIKAALQHINEGYPLGIFPAGEVSTHKERGRIVDKEWEPGAIRLIQKAKVPVVPIYFHATNSKLFYFLSKISDTLRTAKLPSELAKSKKRVIKIRIGMPISVKTQAVFPKLKDFGDFLRKKTYLFANVFEDPKIELKTKGKKIVKTISKKLIIDEINGLEASGDKLFDNENYELFLGTAKQIPNILNEIGRLREITFREVGEGTNEATDLDEFDLYYRHLILWDKKEQIIIGAYRMGFGTEIYKEKGIDGFYLHKYYDFAPELYDMMSKTIEMGRAFVIKEYQQKPMPLFLLWKGVIRTALKYPDHKYLLGSVSMSNHFSNFSKSLMTQFIQDNFQDKDLTKFLRTKNEYKVDLHPDDKDFVLNDLKLDLNSFDKLINELEPGSLRMPVLIKKYIKQNVKALTFTVDPDFSDTLDCLMYVKVKDIPDELVQTSK